VNLLAIDPQAKATAVQGLKLARLEVRYVSVLMRQPNGTYKYESRRKESAIDESELALPASGLALKLNTEAPGNFAYVVRDADGQQLARVDYQVAGEGNVTRALEKNAELEMTLSKKDYAPGEEVELSIRAPYEGAGLITIERDRVYAWRWFKTSTNSTVQKIKLPEGLEGNAYVAVTFVRDPGSSEIYTSPLSYGVQPFSIDVDARRNPAEGDEERLQHDARDAIGSADREPARRGRRVERCGGRNDAAHARQHLGDRLGQLGCPGRRHHALGRSQEQGVVEHAAEPAEPVADRRGRQAEPFRGAAHVALLQHHLEQCEEVEVGA